jgi:hypothetical protein
MENGRAKWCKKTAALVPRRKPRVAKSPGPLLARVTGKHERVNRLSSAPVAARSLRPHVRATNGDPLARVFEIRCYGS